MNTTHPAPAATEAAAVAQRAASKIDLRYCAHSCIDDTGWPETTEIVAIIAAEFGPLLARAEAADRLAEAVYAHTQAGRLFSVDYCKQCNEIMLSLAAYRAANATDAEGVGTKE